MFESDDQELLKKLKKKKKSFSDVVNRKKLDRFELDQAMQEEF